MKVDTDKKIFRSIHITVTLVLKDHKTGHKNIVVRQDGGSM